MFLLFVSFGLVGCGIDVTQVGTQVTISSLSSEDVTPTCTYDLIMQSPEQQQGVLVMFDRADTYLLYNDKAFQAEALALHYAILRAQECWAGSFNDLQPDAAKGPGRMLFAALSEFASVTQHPELETAGLILYGFSAAGVLTATMANDYPDRLLGIIQYAPGSAYLDLDAVPVTAVAAKIPALILANADDTMAGTAKSLRYFNRGRAAGAPWAYGVQNATQHCCNLSTESVVLPWIRATAAANVSKATANATPLESTGTMSQFACTPDGVSDSAGEMDCRFTKASLGDTSPPLQDNGWLPDQASGAAWLSWVTSPQTN